MKLRSFFYGLVATVAVLLAVGIGGFFWLTANSPLGLLQGGSKTSPAAAIFIPRQAPMMASLLVSPDRLQSFRLSIAKPGKRQQAKAELEELKQTLLSKQGLNYEQDIQPWLGDEITIAVTTPDVDRDASNGEQPGYLLALATRNPQRSREFLQLFWQKRAVGGTDLVFEQFSGVKLIYGTPPQATPSASSQALTPTLASAVVGDRFVLFANYPKVLRDAINNVQVAELNLDNSRTYQQALRRLPGRQVGAVFVNLPQLGEWIGNTNAASGVALDSAERRYESLLVALQLHRQGVLAETALLAAPGQTLVAQKPALTKPVDALQFIPAVSPLSASGKNLGQLWHQTSSELAGYGLLSSLITQSLSGFEALQADDASQDVLDWVQGEYALGVLPKTEGQPSDWIFVAQRSPDVDGALERLDAIARQQGLSIGPLQLGDQAISAWTQLSTTTNARRKKETLTLQADVKGAHTTVGDYEIFASSMPAMNEALKANQNALVTAADFQRAIEALDAQNDGYLYIDWPQVHGLVEQRIPLVRLAEVVAKPLFDHLRSLTISSYGSEPTLHRGAVLVQLKDA